MYMYHCIVLSKHPWALARSSHLHVQENPTKPNTGGGGGGVCLHGDGCLLGIIRQVLHLRIQGTHVCLVQTTIGRGGQNKPNDTDKL